MKTLKLLAGAVVLLFASGAMAESGVVKFFNGQKGFGFIIVDGTKQEIFVHQSGLKAPIAKNDRVTFRVTEGKRGPMAVDVVKAAAKKKP